MPDTGRAEIDLLIELFAPAGRDFCRGGVREGDGPDGGVHRHLGPRRHQPGDRAGGRHAGQRAHGGHHRAGAPPHDRHGRLPGDAHRRDHPPDHQAQLPGTQEHKKNTPKEYPKKQTKRKPKEENILDAATLWSESRRGIL
eukprot:9469270-Pyramimonas_sp.AAC.3